MAVSPVKEQTNSGILRADERWVAIQTKTFANWCNEQLSAGGRSVENIETDFCDGVKLVALIESLQLRKIGRVYNSPSSRIQRLQNATLALQAISDDNIRLVNIGPEDIVNGNVKLILGLLWHLILRYQISANKTKAPPKKLMLEWFQGVLQGVSVKNFTTDWSDGVALHALVNYCKPGICPNWQKLDRRNRVENCRRAMQLAKDHLNVPRVITPEDFASEELDELSAMTYLSYFIKKDSPGYYAMLNWVCRQIKTTNISNLTVDWNDGYYLCSVVQSLGGTVQGWPNLDRSDNLKTCQKGIDGARGLGIEPVLTAVELSDPHVDHLAVMAYLSKFLHFTPPVPKSETLVIHGNLEGIKKGVEGKIYLTCADNSIDKAKVKVTLVNPSNHRSECLVVWKDMGAECRFIPSNTGQHKVQVFYDGEEIVGSPVHFQVMNDVTKVKFLTSSGTCCLGEDFEVKIDSKYCENENYRVEAISDLGDLQLLSTQKEGQFVTAIFRPALCGKWTVYVYLDGEKVDKSIHVSVYDPSTCYVTGPSTGMVGDTIVCTVTYSDAVNDVITTKIEHSKGHVLHDVKMTTVNDKKTLIQFLPETPGQYKVKAFILDKEVNGSPVIIDIYDLETVTANGEGLERGVKGEVSQFYVRGDSIGQGQVAVSVEAKRMQVAIQQRSVDLNCCEYRYMAVVAGLYTINIMWHGRHIKGSPYQVRVTDRSVVTLLDDLSQRMDDRDYIALDYDQQIVFHFDISKAGPGTFSAEVLGPQGKLPVHVNQTNEVAMVSFTARDEGDHYIHLYWADHPLDISPMLAYCAGPPGPVDARNVTLSGQGLVSARTTVQATFVVDGRKAGHGKLKVEIKGVRGHLPVDITPMKYDRYKCSYIPPLPGGFLLFVYWSDVVVPGCPYKVSVIAMGEVGKVKVTGEGLKGGIAGHELKIFVDTREAGPGEISATCSSHRELVRVDVKENDPGHYTLRMLPSYPDKHLLQIMYDGQHVPGSPFVLRIGEPPDASKVRVVGPGVEDGIIYTFESRFIVETFGAGAGQLAVRIRGPKSSFKVDMQRHSENDRTITCRYDPAEPGQYVISVCWSGQHVPRSPFIVNIVESREELKRVLQSKGKTQQFQGEMWRAEI